MRNNKQWIRRQGQRAIFALIVIGAVIGAWAAGNSPTIHAQPVGACAPAALIEKLAQLRPTGDNAKDIGVLTVIESQIAAVRVACAGQALTFTGEADKAFGPLDFPKGTYRVSATSTAALAVSVITVSGDCGYLALLSTTFEILPEPRTLEDVFQAGEACRAMVKVTGVGPAWEVTFTPVK
jgi:hypothetical protein